jgi:hypothetical protein
VTERKLLNPETFPNLAQVWTRKAPKPAKTLPGSLSRIVVRRRSKPPELGSRGCPGLF